MAKTERKIKECLNNSIDKNFNENNDKNLFNMGSSKKLLNA